VSRRLLAFALRLMRRYRLRPHVPGGPGLVFRRVVQHRPTSVSNTFVSQQLRTAMGCGARDLHIVRRHELRTQQVQQLPRVERQGAETFFERIASRSERVERVPSRVHAPPDRRLWVVAAPDRSRSHEAPTLPSVPAPTAHELVTRRLRIERREPAPHTDATPAVAAAAQGATPATPAVAPPVVDVARLADQVIDVIDRRIVAQRERLGRP
jgi:hypothetical protein